MSPVRGDTRETLPTVVPSPPVCPANVLDILTVATQIQEGVSVNTIPRETSVRGVSLVTMVTLKMAPSLTVSPAPALTVAPVHGCITGTSCVLTVRRGMVETFVTFVWMVTMEILREVQESIRTTRRARNAPVMITLIPMLSEIVTQKLESA